MWCALLSSFIALKVIVNGLAKIARKTLEIQFLREDFVALFRAILEIGLFLILSEVCGYVAAFIIKRLTPDYDPSIPIMIVLTIVSFSLFKQ